MDSPAAESRTIIEVERVTFVYGSTPVLLDITLSIKAGDFLAVLGPNGSGKTTLLKIILGLLKPAEGKVKILGKPPEEFKDWELVGYIPQKATHFDPIFPASVREVVSMALRSSKISSRLAKKDQERAIQRSLQLVGMEGFKNRRIGYLSGGQQQRVFIARAIVNKPWILFLDEPTAGVDAETQSHFYDILAALNKKEGITIVLVTHDIGIVNKHITQVACLNQKLVYHGTHEEFCRSNTLEGWLSGGHHLISHRH
jgi:zinc transport system ATP-binding protein